MDTPPPIPGTVDKGQSTKKKQTQISTGCGCLVMLATLFVVIVLVSLGQVPQDHEADNKNGVNPTPATAAYLAAKAQQGAASAPMKAKEAAPKADSLPIPAPDIAQDSSGKIPEYVVKIDQEKESIKLVLDVSLEVDLDSLPNETVLKQISRKVYEEYGGKSYQRMFINFAIPQLDPVPSSHWAMSEFNPDFKVSYVGSKPEDGKWIASQRGKKWEKPGQVVGQWFWLGPGGRITTLVKDGNKCVEYWSMSGTSDMMSFEKRVRKVNGVIRYESMDENDKEFFWSIDEDGRWCQYLDDKLSGVELPLGDVKADDSALWNVKDESAKKPANGRNLVNLNTATHEQLRTLPGIDKVIAGRIIAYRNEHPFEDIYELDRIKGIGEKRMAALERLITVE